MDEDKLKRIVVLHKQREGIDHELKHLMAGGTLGQHGEPKKRGRKPNGEQDEQSQEPATT